MQINFYSALTAQENHHPAGWKQFITPNLTCENGGMYRNTTEQSEARTETVRVVLSGRNQALTLSSGQDSNR